MTPIPSTIRAVRSTAAGAAVAALVATSVLGPTPVRQVRPVEAHAGPVIAVEPAQGPSVLAGAASARVVRYRARGVDGVPVPMTGLILMPRVPAQARALPFVVYNHMTTGAADRCAPSSATEDSSELRRMTQGDDLARRLLAAGVPVLRPDYEGMGGPGTHPYLVADSLASAVTGLVRAAHRVEPRLGRRWVVAGHSEGGVATLATLQRDVDLPSPLPGRLVGAAAFAPATGVDVVIEALRRFPLATPPAGEFSITGISVALAGLILQGFATVDPGIARLLREGGLSPEAERLLPDLDRRCLQDLAAADSWGGLAPADVLGPRGEQLAARTFAALRANDPRQLRLRTSVPIRIDAALADEVVLLPLMERLVRDLRADGQDVTVRRWPTSHSGVTTDQNAAPEAAAWILARLGR
ncbi:lipase family protein [Nocardioides sp.]|uniref:lipase family protein n=1 Tax=Nocardioides sp. TaxID=35761 RepID=UPI0035118569